MKTKIVIKNILALIFFVLVHNSGFGQNHIIHGMVHTLDSIPLIGAKITVKSTKQSVLTDSLGRFVIVCNADDKMVIRANGFYNQSVKVTEKIKFAAVNLKIKPGKQQREYAIGYGSVTEKEKSGAVDNLAENDRIFSRYNNVVELIRDNFSGVQVVEGEIIIRGSSTFQGSDAALIVIDGVISDNDILNILSPIQIKSIDIIKDGGTAVYGSRGANGVVLIETKKGK